MPKIQIELISNYEEEAIDMGKKTKKKRFRSKPFVLFETQSKQIENRNSFSSILLLSLFL